MELLKQLYKIHSPSGEEKNITIFISKWVRQNVPTAKIKIDNAGNILICKGSAEVVPCYVAHLDQVQKHHSKDFKVIEDDGLLFGYSIKNKRFEGLGADDKNGIYICLQLIKALDNVKIALFVGEEVGGVGSSAVDVSFFENVSYIIECDRRGGNDLIVNASGVALCDDIFLNDMLALGGGFAPADGLFTDVANLVERGVNVSCCNLSCGYYNPHTDEEMTVFSELLKTLKLCKKMALQNGSKKYIYEYTAVNYGYFGGYDDYLYNDEYMIIEDIINCENLSFGDLWHNYKDIIYCSKKTAKKIYNDIMTSR